jgi:hypothetical protein
MQVVMSFAIPVMEVIKSCDGQAEIYLIMHSVVREGEEKYLPLEDKSMYSCLLPTTVMVTNDTAR